MVAGGGVAGAAGSGPRVDLNADVGEGFGPYRLGADDEVLAWVTSANVACGFHAGDPRTMRRTVALCRDRGVAVGGHPGFPDRVGFGRRALAVAPEEIETDVVYQLGALLGFCQAAGVPLQHVKPHGALYHLAARDRGAAEAVVAAVRAVAPGACLFAPPGSALAAAGAAAGLRVALEGFPDRRYNSDGTLASRETAGALVEDPEEAAARAVRMVREGWVEATGGVRVPLEVHTLCVHGDTPRAAALLRRIRERLEEAGIRVAAPSPAPTGPPLPGTPPGRS